MNEVSTLRERSERLVTELEQDSIAIPATGSMLLHSALAGAVVLYALLTGIIHHDTWGDVGQGSAVQANLVSSSLPLPNDQPVNDNVLPTDNPSTAPAPPEKKQAEADDKDALAISDKVKQQQEQQKKQQQQQKPEDQNKAQFGQQNGSAIARSTEVTRGPLKLSNADFASKFGWYADGISRKMAQNTYRNEIDGTTPAGTVAEIHFRVSRDGVPSNFKLITPSSSPSLNSACMHAAQRIDTFGRLPDDSHDPYVDVTYDCKY